MQWSEHEPIEPVPTLKRWPCRVLANVMALGLNGGPWLIGLWAWLEIHWTIGLGMVLFGYLVAGIISSKMRQLSVPIDQREISFSSSEIARWFVVRYLICEKSD